MTTIDTIHLSKRLPRRTMQNIEACEALELEWWSEHPKPGYLWAVDDNQRAHIVRLNRTRGTAHHECGYGMRLDAGIDERCDWTGRRSARFTEGEGA